jgi:hypothetical protein
MLVSVPCHLLFAMLNSSPYLALSVTRSKEWPREGFSEQAQRNHEEPDQESLT